MNTRFLTMAATALMALTSVALAAEPVITTTTETTPAGNSAVTTTTIIPAPGQAATATTSTTTPVAPAVVDGPRDAITGEVVLPKVAEEEKIEDESLRDKVRDKMKNKSD